MVGPKKKFDKKSRNTFKLMGKLSRTVQNTPEAHKICPRPEAGIALNMRTKISMFLDDDPTITKVTLANSKKHTYWLIGSILY